jgi:two-component system LytT family response regulator
MTTPRTRVLIVDDEPLARERLRTLLEEEPAFELVGEAADGTTGAESILALQPDLVFLDVQMPGADGFDVIDAVGADKMPFVVFVTAYDRYALRAFDVHALDYLLKPFDRERFREALGRAQAQIERNTGGDIERRLAAIVQDLKPARARTDRFVVKSGGRIFFVRTAEIDWIEAAGNYVKLHLGEDSHLFRETMNNMEARLDGHRFVRIHRSRIVNTDRIKELQPWFNGEYVVVLQNGARLTLSRGYREKLQERLGKAF